MSYSPAIGRWMEQDPTGAAYIDGSNLYNAFDNDPVSKIDPDGLFAMDLAFNAFIPKSDGQPAFDGNDFNWFPAHYPWSFVNYLENSHLRTWDWFETDNREDPGDKGTSRIHTDITFDSTNIGKLTANGNVVLKTGSDLTYLMHATAVGDDDNIPGTRMGEVISKRPSPNGSIEVKNNGNSSTITLEADAGDPLAKVHAPKIFIEAKWTVSTCDSGKTVVLNLAGSHTKYPAFEGIADGKLDYGYKPTDTSPGFFNLGHFASIDMTPPPPLTLTD